jgi:hypothetical protein
MGCKAAWKLSQIPEKTTSTLCIEEADSGLVLTKTTFDENREIHIKVRMDFLKIAEHEAGAEQKVWNLPDKICRLAQESFQANEIVAIL